MPVTEDMLTAPISPYGWSKLMTEIMLRDAGAAHNLGYVILRYFNVAGADPNCRTGQSTKNATQLIKVAVEVALGLRSKLDIYGSDYPTPDGTCIRDYIHVSDLVRAHSDALRYLRAGGASVRPAVAVCPAKSRRSISLTMEAATPLRDSAQSAIRSNRRFAPASGQTIGFRQCRQARPN